MTTGTELRSAVAHARLCLELSDVDGALGQLERALPDLISAQADPDESIAEAATLYAAVLLDAATADLAMPWAELAHRTYCAVAGPSSAAALQAESVLGKVWTTLGDHDRAVDAYADLARRLPERLGPDHRQVFNGRADYAAALHRAGRCVSARALLSDGCRSHDAVFGPGDRDGIKMLARLGAMTRDCHDFDGAHACFAEAKQRCRNYLPADDPLRANVSRLARSEADPGHECRPEVPVELARATFGRRRRPPARPGLD
jgi:tetratricopeptide (TPR) repeat protein